MSYTPTEWKTGDVITADKLNNIEQGIVNAGGDDFVVNVEVKMDPSTGETISAEADKSATEILNAVLASKRVVVYLELLRYLTNSGNNLVGRNRCQMTSINCFVNYQANPPVPNNVVAEMTHIFDGKLQSIKLTFNADGTVSFLESLHQIAE